MGASPAGSHRREFQQFRRRPVLVPSITQRSARFQRPTSAGRSRGDGQVKELKPAASRKGSRCAGAPNAGDATPPPAFHPRLPPGFRTTSRGWCRHMMRPWAVGTEFNTRRMGWMTHDYLLRSQAWTRTSEAPLHLGGLGVLRWCGLRHDRRPPAVRAAVAGPAAQGRRVFH